MHSLGHKNSFFPTAVLTLACLAIIPVGISADATIDSGSKRQCPAGYYLENKGNCTECKPGTFTAIPNSSPKCLRCETCDTGGNKYEKKPCKSNNNIECGCKKGYFQNSNADCQRCSICENCLHCSACFPERCDFCKSGKDQSGKKECQQCQTLCSNYTVYTSQMTKATTQKLQTNSPNPSIIVTPRSIPHLTIIGLALLVILMFIVLVSGILVLIKNVCRGFGCCLTPEKKKCLPARDTPCNGQQNRPETLMLNNIDGIPLTPLVYSPTKTGHLVLPLIPNGEPRIHRQESHGERWPAMMLYAVIKEVPLRRWKEFLRLLSISDRQLERIELEPGLSFLERQYQILRLWSQGPDTSLEDVYSALRYMELEGCVQQLQESLMQLMSWSQAP
ncbi:hypothetical protein DPEC_G00007460 [Dallia pectoralis]|uniref:Uncharacterized protein n=1 Tax=Dallia pectoralis TaxID=75939 RepID=A0ACC2HLW3_DALPE|nr:hypothetical protein DPEC_G00007460 [Dallia pectoralis]